MLTGRNVLIATLTIAAVSLVSATLSLTSTGSNDLGANSFGVRAHGQRGLFEILQELDVSAERVVGPPTEALSADATLAFLGPDPELVEVEPAYIIEVAEWVRRGGRLLYAPRYAEAIGSSDARSFAKTDRSAPKSFLELMGISGVRFLLVDDLESDKIEPAAPRPWIRETEPDFDELFEGAFFGEAAPVHSLPVNAEGAWTRFGGSVATLAVPRYDLQVLTIGNAPSRARITVESASDEPVAVAASFPVGKGEVVVLSDQTIAQNRFVAKEDNAVLLVDLLAGQGGAVVFDEFYHGLTVRGNPLVLLRRPAFHLAAGTPLCDVRRLRVEALHRAGSAGGAQGSGAAHAVGIRRGDGASVRRGERSHAVSDSRKPRRRAPDAPRRIEVVALETRGGRHSRRVGAARSAASPTIPRLHAAAGSSRHSASANRTRSVGRIAKGDRLSLDELYERIREEIAKVIHGMEEAIDLSLAALFSSGHVLLEGPPGTAKTLLVRTMAAALDLRFGRIQLTPDLLPSDITGSSIYREDTHSFEFVQGPIFHAIPARRRSQPRLGPHAVGNARSDAGTRRHLRRRDASAPRAVSHLRHPKPHRAGGDVPVAVGAARSIHVQGPRDLSGAGRRRGDLPPTPRHRRVVGPRKSRRGEGDRRRGHSGGARDDPSNARA